MSVAKGNDAPPPTIADLTKELRSLVKATSVTAMLPPAPGEGMFVGLRPESSELVLIRRLCEQADEDRVSHLVMKAKFNSLRSMCVATAIVEWGLPKVDETIDAMAATEIAKINKGIRDQALQLRPVR